MKDCQFSMIVSLFLIPMKDLFRENLNNEEPFTTNGLSSLLCLVSTNEESLLCKKQIPYENIIIKGL